jgi:hypothetical protein
MVKRIVGYDDSGKKVFERDARTYDQSITDSVFGITLSDVFKIIPIFALAINVYSNQKSFNERILDMTNRNSEAISAMSNGLNNINNSLSAITGKQYKDGISG